MSSDTPSTDLIERARQIGAEFQTRYGPAMHNTPTADGPLALRPDPDMPATAVDPRAVVNSLADAQVMLARVWPMHPALATEVKTVLVRHTRADRIFRVVALPLGGYNTDLYSVLSGHTLANFALRGLRADPDLAHQLVTHYGAGDLVRFEPLPLTTTLLKWRREDPKLFIAAIEEMMGATYRSPMHASVVGRLGALVYRARTSAFYTGTCVPRSVFDPQHAADTERDRRAGAYDYKVRANGRKALADDVRDALRALRACSPTDEVERVDGAKIEAQDLLPGALRSIAEAFNDWLRTSAMTKISNVLYDAAGDSPWESSYRPIKQLGCGHWVASQYDDWHTDYHGTTFCEGCLEEGEWVYAVDVEDYSPRDQAYENDDGDHVYHAPDDTDDAALMNWSANGDAYLAHDKSFTPSPLGDFTMGIELESEVTHRYDRKDAVEECDDHFNSGDKLGTYAIFKADGSLDEDCGFEIVTAARRLEDHLAKFKSWEPHGSMRAWDAGSCGMHVHIDSRAFSPLTLGKFMMFMNDHANAKFLRAIAGRHPTQDGQAERYARTIGQGFVADPLKAKDGHASNDRYRVVNLTNLRSSEQNRLQCFVDRCSKGDYSTVEVRIFRATLRKSRLLAQIEFAHAAVMFARVASWHNLTGPAFLDWLRTTQCYPNLSRWFGVAKARNAKADAEVKEAVEV